jgi:hypothetical protein
MRRLLVKADIPSSVILVTLMMEAVRSFKTVLTRPMQHNIPEDGILHSHHRGNLKSYLIFVSVVSKNDFLH